MTPAALRDRLLFVEARLALAEDKLEIFKSQMRLALRALIGCFFTWRSACSYGTPRN